MLDHSIVEFGLFEYLVGRQVGIVERNVRVPCIYVKTSSTRCIGLLVMRKWLSTSCINSDTATAKYKPFYPKQNTNQAPRWNWPRYLVCVSSWRIRAAGVASTPADVRCEKYEFNDCQSLIVLYRWYLTARTVIRSNQRRFLLPSLPLSYHFSICSLPLFSSADHQSLQPFRCWLQMLTIYAVH